MARRPGRAPRARRRRSSSRSRPSGPCRRGAAADVRRARRTAPRCARPSAAITSSSARPLRAAMSWIDCATYSRFLPRNSPCGSCGALPVRLDAEPPPRDVGVGAEERTRSRRPTRCRTRLRTCASPRWRVGRQAVGVLRGIEAAQRIGQVAQDVVQRVLGDGREEVVAGGLSRLEIRQHQLRLVVEHLLEVRHAPLAVDRVAMEAAADVIAHAAHRHRAQRVGGHQQRRLRRAPPAVRRACSRSRNSSSDGRGKLRRVAEAAAAAIERHLELLDADVERVGAGDRRDSARARPSVPVTDLQPVEQLRRRAVDLARGPRATRGRARRADRRSPAGPSAMSAGSRCRRRTASAPASGTRSSASRRIPSSPGRTTCRRDRRPAAPRGRP